MAYIKISISEMLILPSMTTIKPQIPKKLAFTISSNSIFLHK